MNRLFATFPISTQEYFPLNANNDDNVSQTVRRLLEQQMQQTLNMQHGMLHQLYQQIEAFVTINSLLDIRHPLPPMRGWAASPDFLALVMAEILAQKPRLIVELGSGVSTLVTAYTLQKLGQGRLISLDHDNRFLQKTRQQLELHGLTDLVHTIHTPLASINLDGTEWQWYDMTAVEIPDPVDILVVDGPPGTIQPRSRYPALRVFAQHLSAGAVVFLDDAARPDERAIVSEWATQYPEFTHELVNCEKGASVFRRSRI